MSGTEEFFGQSPPSDGLGDCSDAATARLRKVRTGCAMCKARKVKCDEQKPFCQRCTIGRRKCPGYTTPPPQKPSIRRSKYDIDVNELSRAHSGTDTNADTESATSEFSPDSFPAKLLLPAVPRPLDSIDDFNEGRGIHFLQLHASLDVSAYFEGEFWQCSLQASQSEPTIRHALLAVSSLYEAQEFSEPASDRSRSLTRFALQQYTKAIHLLSNNTGDTAPAPQVVLISCLIFIWLEFLHDNIDIALGHLRSGIRILSDQPRTSQCRDPDGFLFLLFTRLHTQAALHGSPSSDFDPNETFLAAGDHSQSETKFSSIREARTSLDSKLNGIFRFHRMIEHPEFLQKSLREHYLLRRLEERCQSHIDGLQAWKVAYDDMSQRCHLTNQQGSLCLHELELQYLITANTLTTLFATTPMVYDAYNAEFARIVHLSKEIIRQRRPQRRILALPFDTGVLAPLYYVLLKCRDSTIRREAMALLHECPEREGMWDRATIIEFAEWKIAKEEQGRALLGVPAQDPLPEEVRIYCEKARAAVIDDRSVTVMSFKRGAYGGITDVEPDEEEITALSMRMAAMLGT